MPGHWEGDLLVGSRNSYIATLVERRSRYVCLVRVTGKETAGVLLRPAQSVAERHEREHQRLAATVLPPGRNDLSGYGQGLSMRLRDA